MPESPRGQDNNRQKRWKSAGNSGSASDEGDVQIRDKRLGILLDVLFLRGVIGNTNDSGSFILRSSRSGEAIAL